MEPLHAQARGKSELDLLSLPLLLRDDDVLLVSDERAELVDDKGMVVKRGGWPKVESLESERAFREWLGVGMKPDAALGAKNSRTLTERLAKMRQGKDDSLPTLEELRMAMQPTPGVLPLAEVPAAPDPMASPRTAERSRGNSVRAAISIFGGKMGSGKERSESVAVSSAAAVSRRGSVPVAGGGAGSGALQEGYLEKEGGLMKNRWERRFFILTHEGTLFWFNEGKPKDVALGSLQVGGDGASLKTLGVKLSFELTTAKKSYVLRTQDGRELADWLKALRQVITARDLTANGQPAAGAPFAIDLAPAAALPATAADLRASTAAPRGGVRAPPSARSPAGPPGRKFANTSVGADVEAALSEAAAKKRPSAGQPTIATGPKKVIAQNLGAALSRGNGSRESVVTLPPQVAVAASAPPPPAALPLTSSSLSEHNLPDAAGHQRGSMASSRTAADTARASSRPTIADGGGYDFEPDGGAAAYGRARAGTIATAAPPATSVPLGLLSKTTAKRGTKLPRFFLIRDSVLLYYEVTKENRSVWERLTHEKGATSGGWQPAASGSGASDGRASHISSAGVSSDGGNGASGDWVVRSQDEVWRPGEPLCEALDPKHPSGAVPLVDVGVEPLKEEEGYGLRVLWYNNPSLEAVKMLCSSAAERDAWITAMRDAKHVTMHKVYTTALAKENAEGQRDAARRERDGWRLQAEDLREEARANEAAAQRARTQLESLTSRQRRDGEILASRDEELERARNEREELSEAKEKVQAALKRAEERAARLLDERDAANAATAELEAKLEVVAQTKSDALGKASSERERTVELQSRLAAAEAALELERAKTEAADARGAALAAEATAAEKAATLSAAKAAALGEAADAAAAREAEAARSEDAAVAAAREALLAEQRALSERKAARAAAASKAPPQRPRRLTASASSEDVGASAPRASIGGLAMPRLSLPQPRKSIDRGSSGPNRSSRSVSADTISEDGEHAPPVPLPPRPDSWVGPPPPPNQRAAGGPPPPPNQRAAGGPPPPPNQRAAGGPPPPPKQRGSGFVAALGRPASCSTPSCFTEAGAAATAAASALPASAMPAGARGNGASVAPAEGRPSSVASSPRGSLSPAADAQAAAQAAAQAQREQLEAEQLELRKKKEEREARRLRRQLELAEATQEPPPPPPEPPPVTLKTRGRQYSNVI